jgi:methionyl-tRNA synthetase
VWFDAVIGYLSASIEWARRSGDPEAWRRWWNDPESLSYYFMGKDNIVFHSQIWPAELLAYDGRGARGGEPGAYGDLQLPTEVVSSEFMTMESKQFSTSRGHVILVGDMLSRYQPDALRYFISAAGPETSDSDFTWAEFVQRTNSELVAGWGNLVNRTATMIAKSFGEIPAAGALEEVDEAMLSAVREAFGTVGDLIGRHRQRAAIGEAMRVVGEVNKYLTVTEPYKMKDESQRERLATVLHVAAQCVVDCNTLLAPFLPHSSNQVWAAYGGEGEFMPMPRIEHVEDLDPGHGAGLDFYPVITGDYSGTPRWESRPVTVGAKVDKPSPIFTKLDPSVVDEELARFAERG